MVGLSMLAEFGWDPQIRGILILVTAVAILPGSVYLLLATNLGARIGFLIAVAGLSGWLTLMGTLWWLNAQGMKGRPPAWDAEEVVFGVPAESPLPQLEGLPGDVSQPPSNGWRVLEAGSPVLGDATATADKLLAPDTGPLPHGQAERPEPPFPPPFGAPTDYKQIAAFEKGGEHTGVWFSIRQHRFYKISEWWNPVGWFRAPPHRVVIVVQKLGPDLTPSDPRDERPVDLSQKPVTLALLRDRGSVRFPPVMITLASLMIFLTTCYSLHRRDKQVIAQRAAGNVRPATA